MNTKFSDIDVEDIQTNVDKYDKAATMCGLAMKENPMCAIFKDMVQELKSTIPVVTALRAPELKPNHWEEIYSVIGMKLDLENDQFTL